MSADEILAGAVMTSMAALALMNSVKAFHAWRAVKVLDRLGRRATTMDVILRKAMRQLMVTRIEVAAAELAIALITTAFILA